MAGQPPDSETTQWIRFEFARHVHAYLQDQIRFSDAKAGVTAAVAGVLFGAFREVTRGALQAFPPTSIAGGLAFAAAALFAILSLLAVLNAYRVIRPRMPRAYERVAPHHRLLEGMTELFDRETAPSHRAALVNWADIAEHATSPDGPAAYARAVRGAGPAELTEQLLGHAVMLALIAGQKYQHVRLALNSLFLAALALVALMTLLGMS
ncbi:MAG: Pycsar system effector family protein [Candidatus Limnocylindria bacterium]